MSLDANINAATDPIADRNDPAMIDAIRQYMEYEFSRTASAEMPAMGAEVEPEVEAPEGRTYTPEIEASPITRHTLEAMDNVGDSATSAVGVGVPAQGTFAGLAGGVAGVAGAVGQKAFALGAAMTTDDDELDALLPDSEIEEPAIEAPEIGPEPDGAELTPEQQRVSAAVGQLDLAWQYQMHALTQAKMGNPELLEAAGLDQNDIALIDNLPNMVDKGQSREMMA